MAVAFGANLPSHLGPPEITLKAVRPIMKKLISIWIEESLDSQQKNIKTSDQVRWRWSPLFETAPIGGPNKQPSFINAVVVVDRGGIAQINPKEKLALDLLERFLELEKSFGRDRKKNSLLWGPRTLDIDLLAWGALQINTKKLTLPHPRLIERNFVVVPLAEALNLGGTPPRCLPLNQQWLD